MAFTFCAASEKLVYAKAIACLKLLPSVYIFWMEVVWNLLQFQVCGGSQDVLTVTYVCVAI